MPTGSNVAALLLAAGRGSRFGGRKLEASLRGVPIIGHVSATIDAAIRAGTVSHGLAVLAAGDDTVRQLVAERGFRHVENPDSDRGISSSLQLGLKALAADPGIGAILIVLGDQPLLRLEVIHALVDHWHRTGRSARPRYAADPNQPGHPVLLDRQLWKLADGMSGDAGLRGLLAAGQVEIVDVEGENPDVDTPGDLSSL